MPKGGKEKEMGTLFDNGSSTESLDKSVPCLSGEMSIFFCQNWILNFALSNPLLLPSVVVLFTSFPPSSSSSFSQADHWRRMRGEFRLLWMEEREKNPTTTHDSPNRQKGGKKCRLLPPFLYLLFREFLRWILRNITDNQGNCVFRECYSS